MKKRKNIKGVFNFIIFLLWIEVWDFMDGKELMKISYRFGFLFFFYDLFCLNFRINLCFVRNVNLSLGGDFFDER